MGNRTLNISPISIAILLVTIFGISSCKNKKKIAELSDPVEVREEIAQEDKIQEEPIEVKERIVTKEPSKEAKLDSYFSSISSANSTSAANSSINKALSMFSNEDAPVLIVIYKENGKPSYDEPTTISKYLNYLKDTKNNKAKVEEVVVIVVAATTI